MQANDNNKRDRNVGQKNNRREEVQGEIEHRKREEGEKGKVSRDKSNNKPRDEAELFPSPFKPTCKIPWKNHEDQTDQNPCNEAQEKNRRSADSP